MAFQQYVKRTSSACINQVTNEVLNSPAQTRTGHQVSTPYPFTALAPPSFPSRPGPSTLMDGRSEDSLTVDNYAHRRTGKDLCTLYSRCRRMSFA
jgi:hypothetical protein